MPATNCAGKIAGMNVDWTPIFVVGCPRSGTSVTKKILRRHSGLTACGVEHHYILALYDTFGEWLPSRADGLEFFGASPGSFLSAMPAGDIAHLRSTTGPIRLTDFLGELWSIAADSPHDRPILLQYAGDGLLRARELAKLFPSARFLVLQRDPRANVASQVNSFRGRSCSRSISLWKECFRATELAQRELAQRTLVVPYEAFVQETELWLRRIVAFLGLQWEAAVADFEVPMAVFDIRGEVEHRTFSELDPEMLDKWRAVLKPSQVALVEWRCRAELTRLSLQPEGRSLSMRDVPFLAADASLWGRAKLASLRGTARP